MGFLVKPKQPERRKPIRFTSLDTRQYWEAMHAVASRINTSNDPDMLAIVCHPAAPLWYNRYVAHFQRLAFDAALSRCGSLRGTTVLEVGCGTGRWSRLMRDRGSRVLAIDISEEAIRRNRARIHGVDFRCADILEFDAAGHRFDFVISITVLQHLTPEDQERAADKIAELVRPQGYVVALENLLATNMHMFSRSLAEWGSLFARRGLALVYEDGFGYDLPLRLLSKAEAAVIRSEERNRIRGAKPATQIAEEPFSPQQRTRRILDGAVRAPTVWLSYLLEPLGSVFLSRRWATHCALAFRKPMVEESTT